MLFIVIVFATIEKVALLVMINVLFLLRYLLKFGVIVKIKEKTQLIKRNENDEIKILCELFVL